MVLRVLRNLRILRILWILRAPVGGGGGGANRFPFAIPAPLSTFKAYHKLSPAGWAKSPLWLQEAYGLFMVILSVLGLEGSGGEILEFLGF